MTRRLHALIECVTTCKLLLHLVLSEPLHMMQLFDMVCFSSTGLGLVTNQQNELDHASWYVYVYIYICIYLYMSVAQDGESSKSRPLGILSVSGRGFIAAIAAQKPHESGVNLRLRAVSRFVKG